MGGSARPGLRGLVQQTSLKKLLSTLRFLKRILISSCLNLPSERSRRRLFACQQDSGRGGESESECLCCHSSLTLKETRLLARSAAPCVCRGSGRPRTTMKGTRQEGEGGREGGGGGRSVGRSVGRSGFRVGTAASSPLLTFLTSASPSLSAVMRRCLSSTVVLPSPPPPSPPLPSHPVALCFEGWSCA